MSIYCETIFCFLNIILLPKKESFMNQSGALYPVATDVANILLWYALI